MAACKDHGTFFFKQFGFIDNDLSTKDPGGQPYYYF